MKLDNEVERLIEQIFSLYLSLSLLSLSLSLSLSLQLLPLPSNDTYQKDTTNSVKDSGISSYESANAGFLGDQQSFSSVSDRASSSVDDLPEALKEDIANSAQLLHVALQVSGTVITLARAEWSSSVLCQVMVLRLIEFFIYLFLEERELWSSSKVE